jgi:hypothetical protein
LEASKHPDIAIFQRVSGVFPGMDDYREVIDAAQLLRRSHPDEHELESYLLPFWLAWQGRKRKDGQPVNKTNPTWFVEWAVNNYVPDFRGSEQKPDKVSRSKAALQRVRARVELENPL